MAKKTSKTTEEHFKIFKEECEYWLTKFNLKCYSIYYVHDECEDAYATIQYDCVNRMATIFFNTDFGDIGISEDHIRETAFHEVCELLLGRLAWLAESRYLGSTDIEEELHNIIRTLENTVFKEMKR